MSKAIVALILGIFVFGHSEVANAEPCPCGPVRDISFLPEDPDSLDVLTARIEVRDFSILFQDQAIVGIDLESKQIDLTLITTDVPGNDVDQVQFYPIGQLPSGVYTFNLFLAGFNPPPPLPPIQLLFTTSIEISSFSGASVPSMNWFGIFVLLTAIAFISTLYFRSRES